MNPEKRLFKLTPQEEEAHEETERRRRALEKEGSGVVELDVSPEEAEKAAEAARKREEERPYGE